MGPKQLCGVIFAAHANGATFNRIGAALGISGSRARELDRLTCERIIRLAEERFPLGGRRRLSRGHQ